VVDRHHHATGAAQAVDQSAALSIDDGLETMGKLVVPDVERGDHAWYSVAKRKHTACGVGVTASQRSQDFAFRECGRAHDAASIRAGTARQCEENIR
jgi:hypothetical protein